jgi:two-component system, OmpR family, response regulator
MLPATLALIDDDATFSEYLAAYLQERGVAVQWFADSDDLLCSEKPFGFDFYVVDLMLPGIDGVSLLRLLRRRTQAGMLVVSGKVAADVFDQVMVAGADMHLAKPVSFEQVALAVEAVYRRSGPSSAQQPAWRLDESARRLLAPDGAVIELSPADAGVLACLLEAHGATVARDTLARRLGLSLADDPNLLHATIYRLRRRIERATPGLVPLQSKSRVGYVFRAPLQRA